MSNGRLQILILAQSPSAVRKLVRGFHMHGTTVESDVHEACERFRRGESFDVIVCETTMHAMSAGKLLAAARDLPDPPIVVMASHGNAIGGGTLLEEIDRRVQAKARAHTTQMSAVSP